MSKKFDVSIIIPVFNEEQRIKSFLKDIKKAAKSNWEIIFVDDGSKDKSLSLIRNSSIKNLNLISYKKNKGKGFAVKNGVDVSRGRYVIFIDADGSIHPSQIEKMIKYLRKYNFVVGDRASMDSKVKQPLFRKFFGICFNYYSNILFGLAIRDKLCGFKGFKSSVAKRLFKNLLSKRWVFDIEIFYKAKKEGINPYQMPIEWTYKGKSKMKFYDPLKIALELVVLRLKLMS